MDRSYVDFGGKQQRKDIVAEQNHFGARTINWYCSRFGKDPRK